MEELLTMVYDLGRMAGTELVEVVFSFCGRDSLGIRSLICH